MEAFAWDLGYSLGQLIGNETKTARASAPAQYRHSENPALIWSGEQRKQPWFMYALESGRTAKDKAIG